MKTQRTWFITGVSSGTGRRGLTELLLARGDRVAGTARELIAVDDLKQQYGDQMSLASLEVTDTPAIRRGIRTASQQNITNTPIQ